MENDRTLCVMGLFDGETNRRFQEIKDRITLSGCPADEQEPHITFGIYTGISREALSSYIQEVASGAARIPLYFGQIGIFPGTEVCFISPSVTRALLDFHARIRGRFDRDCVANDCLYSLYGGKWFPHVTLAMPKTCRLNRVLPAILECFHPFEGEIVQMKITEQEPLVEVARFALSPVDKPASGLAVPSSKGSAPS